MDAYEGGLEGVDPLGDGLGSLGREGRRGIQQGHLVPSSAQCGRQVGEGEQRGSDRLGRGRIQEEDACHRGSLVQLVGDAWIKLGRGEVRFLCCLLTPSPPASDTGSPPIP